MSAFLAVGTAITMTLRRSSNWRTLSFPQKAGYLCSTRQARDYSDACSILAKLPRSPRRRPPAILDTKARAKMWWLKES